MTNDYPSARVFLLMAPIAYTISPYLLRYLEKIETIRQQILLYPLSPKHELGLQFHATIDRVHFGLALTGQHVHPEKVQTILANQIIFAIQKNSKYKDPIQTNVLQYKQAIDYIKRDWTLSTKSISTETFLHLYAITGDPNIVITEKNFYDIVTYLQASNDSPFIQAALAKLLFRHLFPDSAYAEVFSTMSSYLFLYQSGMDCRGLLVLEKPWAQDQKLFNGYYATAIARPNVTGWLEYFVKTVYQQLEATFQTFAQAQVKREEEKIGKLNERQKVIMTLLDDPNAIITNRTIQKIFHISPITSSRDLAKLTLLGLLIQQGKGRSVRYTRI